VKQRSRWQSKSFRRVFRGSFCALWLGVACGGNPELAAGRGDVVVAPGGLGDRCKQDNDCKSGLSCGPESVCISRCGGVTGNGCGDEACLASGECSDGLGNDCTNDDDCGQGLVCSGSGQCAVPCKPGAANACKKGATCGDDGTCPTKPDIVIGVGGAGNDGGGGEGAGGAPGCIDLDVEFTPQVPTVLLLIDRSGSMTAEKKFGAAVQAAVDDGTYTLGDCPKDNDWRWNVVRDVLMSPTKGIVKPLEDRVRFGLSLYSSKNGRVKAGSPEEIDETKMCPELIEVPIALDNHQAMLDQFKCNDVDDDTPTGESLLAAAATLKAFKEPGPKVIVLATDGEPDSCECPDTGSNVPAKCNEPGVPAQIKEQVVANAKEIHDGDITVHVINVSTPSEASLQKHLADVAAAGGGKVYPGFSPGELSKAFDEIIDGVRSCVIDLSGEIAKGKESTGVIKLDGDTLGLDDPDGWQVNTPSQIELLGAACDAIKTGDHDISIKFPCESFEPVVVH
jgi:hypothetical protein